MIDDLDRPDVLNGSGPSFFREVDSVTSMIDQKEVLDRLLDDVVELLSDHEEKKMIASVAWEKVEAAQDVLEREMLRQGVKSFSGITSGARVTIVEKAGCDYPSVRKPDVFEFLRENEAGGLITESVRKDTLAKWLSEYAERGGRIPHYIEMRPASYLQVRR